MPLDYRRVLAEKKEQAAKTHSRWYNMGNPTGFLEIARVDAGAAAGRRTYPGLEGSLQAFPEDKLQAQASRCMDCGIPFCHQGCPLGNIIPDWNDLVYRGQWQEALDRLAGDQQFPGVHRTDLPRAVRRVVRAWDQCRSGHDQEHRSHASSTVLSKKGWVRPRPPAMRTGKRVAVVGSGPAGLAAAAQLNQAGHWVTVFERADRIGGLLRYGIPEFKMESRSSIGG